MSIDHGKLIEAAKIVCMAASARNMLAIMKGCEQLSAALAQPAEAVEGADGDSEHAEEVAKILANRGFHAASATVRRLVKKHDAAQGAVAPFAYGADLTPGDYDMEHSVWLLRPGESVPAGCTPLYTHPQAAPAPESPSLKQIVPDRERGPDPDPHTGADRGSCCEHAYADGWNDCVGEVEKRVTVAAQAAPAQGDGWKLVPEYPTMEMLIAGAVARARDAGDDHHDDAKLIYEAMIAAAPSQEGES